MRNCLFVTLAYLLNTDSSTVANFLELQEDPNTVNLLTLSDQLLKKGYLVFNFNNPPQRPSSDDYSFDIGVHLWSILPIHFGITFDYNQPKGYVPGQPRFTHCCIGEKVLMRDGSQRILIKCFQFIEGGWYIPACKVGRFLDFFIVVKKSVYREHFPHCPSIAIREESQGKLGVSHVKVSADCV